MISKKMKKWLPRWSSLYGQIFAIFWLTLLLVLWAVVSLPNFDPRVSRELTSKQLNLYQHHVKTIEQTATRAERISNVLKQVSQHEDFSNQTRIVISDQFGNVWNNRKRNNGNDQARALTHFLNDDNPPTIRQKQYGPSLLVGPFPATIANQSVWLTFIHKVPPTPPFFIRLLDQPWVLLVATMLVSTPLLLLLAYRLSLPAQRFQRASEQVKTGKFELIPELETGTREFRQAGESFNQMVLSIDGTFKAQQQLLSDVSHELRSPLTRIKMAAALAKRKHGDNDEIARIEKEADTLESMIQDLLTMTRLNQDNNNLKHILSAETIWRTVLDDAQFETTELGKQFTLSQIPDCQLYANKSLLASALENVIRNAIRYAKHSVEVTLLVKSQCLHIEIKDDGPGVPSEELDKISRPFYRISQSRNRSSGGAGLGLAITRNAIQQHQGSMTIENHPVSGLVVKLVLPLPSELEKK